LSNQAHDSGYFGADATKKLTIIVFLGLFYVIWKIVDYKGSLVLLIIRYFKFNHDNVIQGI